MWVQELTLVRVPPRELQWGTGPTQTKPGYHQQPEEAVSEQEPQAAHDFHRPPLALRVDR